MPQAAPRCDLQRGGLPQCRASNSTPHVSLHAGAVKSSTWQRSWQRRGGRGGRAGQRVARAAGAQQHSGGEFPPSDPHHRTPEENRDVEADVRYRRVDLSAQHAYQARRAFLENIAAGQGGVDLAAAALQIAAEDDALVSHSTVQLPIASYLQRLARLASDAAVLLEQDAAAAAAAAAAAQAGGGQAAPTAAASDSAAGSQAERGGSGGDADGGRQRQLALVRSFLFDQQRFRLPPGGRSALPRDAVVDHPGVWESARYALLNECLVTREGIPALLAIVLADVMRRLLEAGAVDFAVRVDCSNLGSLPTTEVLPLPPSQVLRPDGTALTTCSSVVLVELLRFLKRAYWPFPWDARHGGFRGAAKVFLEGDASAAMLAINRTARHRLERGIWTSPGAGDIRRALAACERLVVLAGDEAPAERRDLGVLLMHVGRFQEARAELRRFQQLAAAGAAGSSGAAPPGVSFAISPTGLVAAAGQAFEDQVLTDKLLALLPSTTRIPPSSTYSSSASSSSSSTSSGDSVHSVDSSVDTSAEGSSAGGRGGVVQYLTLERALARAPPSPAADEAARLPLTW